MTIIDSLRDPIIQTRVSCGDRWLVCNDNGEFVVYYRPYGAKKTRTLITTTDESIAVAVLTGTEAQP
jgi:hypothetical protein